MREVFMHDDERYDLSRASEKRITGLLDKETTHQTVSTNQPVPLRVNVLQPPSQEFIDLVRLPYDEAHVRISHHLSGEAQQFDRATVRLQKSGTPLWGELTLLSNQLDDTDNHALNPQFYYRSNHYGAPGRETIAPLSAAAAHRLLYGIVSQTASNDTLALPPQTISESLRTLVASASRLVVDRSVSNRYHFFPESTEQNGSTLPDLLDAGSVTVSLRDTQLHSLSAAAPHVIGSTVEVIKHQSVSDSDLQKTSFSEVRCLLDRHYHDTSAKISMRFGDIDLGNNYDSATELAMSEFSDLEYQYPNKFSHYIDRGLAIAEQLPSDYVKESLSI